MDNSALFYDGFDASFFDEEDDVFGFEEQGLAPASPTSVDPATLAFALLLLSTYTAPPPWNGTASAGTSGSHSFTGADGSVTGATMAERTWQRVAASVNIHPWVGTASAGISGSESWSNVGGINPPGAGGGINGFTTIYFAGAFGENLQAGNAAGQYISATGSSGWMLVKPISILNDSGNPASNDPLLEDAGQYYGITLSATAILGGPAASFFIASGGNIFHVDVAVNLSDWNLLEWRHTGTTIEMRNSTPNSAGVWQVVSNDGLGHNVGNVDAGFAAQALLMGQAAGGTINADFELADIAIQNTAMTYAQLDSVVVDVELYFNKFYAIYPGPTTGASLNGHTSADFDGVFKVGKYAGPLSDLIGPCDRSFYVGAMFKARTVPADTPTARYVNAIIFGDLNQNIYASISAAGISAGMYDQNVGGWVDTGAIACSTGAWHFVQVWHDGQSLWLQLDYGTPISVFVGLDWMVANVASMTPCIGANGSSFYFDGEMHIVDAMQGQPNALQRAGMGMYLQTRYGVSMGFPSGSTGYTRNVGDSVSAPTDGVTRAAHYARGPADAVTKPTDAVARSDAFARTIIESITKPTDAPARADGATRTITEAIAAAVDAVTRAQSDARSVPESITKPTDSPTRSETVTRSIGDAVAAPTDVVTDTKGAVRNVFDAVTIPTDAIARVAGFARGTFESITNPTDSPARSETVARTVSDGPAAPTDSPARALAATRTVPENVTAPTDAVTHAFGVVRNVSETVAPPTDAIAKIVGYAIAPSESITKPADAIARVAFYSRSIGDGVSAPSDSPSRVVAYVRSIGDGAPAPTDSVSFVKNGGATSYTRNVGDSVSAPSDSPARAVIYVRGVPESIAAPTDSPARKDAAARGIAESITAPNDSVTRSEATIRSIGDAVTKPSDSLARSEALVRGIVDSVSAPTDGLTRARGASRTANDAVGAPTDTIARSVGFVTGIVENVVVSDTVGRQYASIRQIGESIARPSDSVAIVRGKLSSISESIAIPTDSIAHGTGYARFIVEVVEACFDTVSGHIVKVPLGARAGGGGARGVRVVLSSAKGGAFVRPASSSFEGRTESPSTRQPGVPSPGPRKR